MKETVQCVEGEHGDEPSLDILMYHSIGAAQKPLGISRDIFRMQLDVINACGFHGISLGEALKRSVSGSGRRAIALTFDDGYKDFVEVALPEIVSRGWAATVFLCSGLVGIDSQIDGPPAGRVPMLNWSDARLAAGQGIEIGSHGISHVDLTNASVETSTHEIEDSRRQLEDGIGVAVTSFAMPYGRTNAVVRDLIMHSYQRAVGTSLGRATPASDPFDLPRIEMWYFQNPRRWRSYLEGDRGYLTARRGLRRVGSFLRGWTRQ